MSNNSETEFIPTKTFQISQATDRVVHVRGHKKSGDLGERCRMNCEVYGSGNLKIGFPDLENAGEHAKLYERAGCELLECDINLRVRNPRGR